LKWAWRHISFKETLAIREKESAQISCLAKRYAFNQQVVSDADIGSKFKTNRIIIIS